MSRPCTDQTMHGHAFPKVLLLRIEKISDRAKTRCNWFAVTNNDFDQGDRAGMTDHYDSLRGDQVVVDCSKIMERITQRVLRSDHNMALTNLKSRQLRYAVRRNYARRHIGGGRHFDRKSRPPCQAKFRAAAYDLKIDVPAGWSPTFAPKAGTGAGRRVQDMSELEIFG